MALKDRYTATKARGFAAGADLATPASRDAAWRYFMFFDHGFLRMVWTNFYPVAPGVFRANQPSPERLRAWTKRGIAAVINLRGASHAPSYAFEREACDALQLPLIDVPHLSARLAPARADLVHLVDVMRQAPRPFVMHCKSGADRTSLAAALYLLCIMGAPLAQARAQFSARFVHFRWTRTGVLDHILDTYEAEAAPRGVDFETWLRTEYDGNAIQARFDKGRA